MRRPEAPGPRRARGSALVIALWVTLLLGVAGMAAVRLAATGAGGAQVEADLARARAAAEGGIWAAAQRVGTRPRDQRPPVVAFEFPLGGAAVSARAEDEDGRLDLNAAPEPLLAAAFRAAGLPAPEAEAAAARLVAWREAGDDPGGRRRKLHAVADLDAALGGKPALSEAVRGVATTHTGRAAPASEAAPPALRAALAHRDDPAASSPPPRAGLRTPQPQGSGGAGRRTIWRVTAEARYGAVTARMAAVLDLTPAGPGMPGRVLEWRDVAGRE
jgi:general secretion pathway protein K